MTFPIVQSSAVTNFSADQTSHVVNLPTGITAGDCLLLWFCMDGTTGTVTTPTGWTLDQGPVLQTDRSLLFSKTANGTEGSTVTIASSLSESSSAIALRITGHQSMVSATNTSGSALMANPPSVTATASATSLLIVFGSSLGDVTNAESINGPVTALFAAGNSSSANNTVSAVCLYANRTTTASEEVAVLTWRLNTARALRNATVLIHGAEVGGGMPLIGPGGLVY